MQEGVKAERAEDAERDPEEHDPDFDRHPRARGELCAAIANVPPDRAFGNCSDRRAMIAMTRQTIGVPAESMVMSVWPKSFHS